MPVPSLTFRRFLRLYLPLSLTFLLMSGSSPIINKGIGNLPDETVGLATFANVFVICLFLYSPCFAARDMGLKFVRGAISYRRVLLFQLAVAACGTFLLLLISLTPALDAAILRGVMRLPAELLGPVKRGILAFLPMPILITLRGIHQAVHITQDTAKWVGIGTAGRFVVIIIFVFAVGVPLRIEGGVMGGLALALGMGTEMAITVATARRGAPFIRREDPDRPSPTYGALWKFAGPLFLANAMGVFLQPLSIAIVNSALAAKSSAAAFGVVKSFTWFFSSTLFAMQAVALSRADSRANLKRLAAYELIPVGLFTSLFLLVALLPPLRSLLLEEFFELEDGEVLRFVTTTFPIALALPALMALRSTARGLLLRGGRTSWVSLSSFTALLLLLGVYAMAPSAKVQNGAVIGYACWGAAMAVETIILVLGVTRVSIETCVTEGRPPAVLLPTSVPVPEPGS